MADSPRSVDRSVRIYKTLMKAYPGSFRKKYEDEMARVFRELITDAWRRRGRIGLCVTWFRVLGDLVRSAPREHLRQWKTSDGGIAVKIKSLLTREIASDKRSHRWAQFIMFAYSLLLPIPFIYKFASLNLTAAQWLFGILVIVALMLQMITFGLVFPLLDKPTGHSRFYMTIGQIVINTCSALVFVLGIWTLKWIVTSEYDLLFSITLLLEVMLSGMFIAGILPILQAARRERQEKQQA